MGLVLIRRTTAGDVETRHFRRRDSETDTFDVVQDFKTLLTYSKKVVLFRRRDVETDTLDVELGEFSKSN